MEDRSFPSTSVVRGLSWFYVSLLHLDQGIRFVGSSLFFDGLFRGCFSLHENEVCCRNFSTFFFLDCESAYSHLFLFFGALSFWIVDICRQSYYLVVLVDGELIPRLLDGC